MNKVFLSIIIYFLSFPTSATAEQMLIELSSGDSLLVEYTGEIGKVSLKGEHNAITGLSLHYRNNKFLEQSLAKPTLKRKKELKEKVKVKKKIKKHNFRLGWADPDMED